MILLSLRSANRALYIICEMLKELWLEGRDCLEVYSRYCATKFFIKVFVLVFSQPYLFSLYCAGR